MFAFARFNRTATALLALVATIGTGPAGLSAQDPDVDDIVPPPPAIPAVLLPAAGDSVVAPPGETFPAGWFHRWFLGDLNRHLWTRPIGVPVLDLDAVGGGLEVSELSGGKQTLGLRLSGKDGQTYQFRSIVKTAARALPGPLRSTAVEDVMQDQMAAQFPLAALIVAEFLETVGVLVAKPRPVVMPDDARLGEYRDLFAGRMGWLEVRPNEGEDDSPGFAGSTKITGSEALYERLREEPRNYVNQERLLRARLIDFLVGDWDRHSDQWRWAAFEDGERTRWEPIPRDRDWAFTRIDGVLPRITAIYFPKYVGFGPEFPRIDQLHWSAQRVDRMLLNGLGRGQFESIAAEVQGLLTDDVIERALGTLPPSYASEVEVLRPALRARRDGLAAYAMEFYELLAKAVSVHGTELSDSVVVDEVEGSTRVRLFAGDLDEPVFARIFDEDDTDEVRLYLAGAADHVSILARPRVKIRAVLASGRDQVVDQTSGANVYIYDSDRLESLNLGPEAFATTAPELQQDSLLTGYLAWNQRDWGTQTIPVPVVTFDSDDGLYVGAGVRRTSFGFAASPYQSQASFEVLRGFGAEDWLFKAMFDRSLSPTLRLETRGRASSHHIVRYFGLGNETRLTRDEGDYLSHRGEREATARLVLRPGGGWSWGVGVNVLDMGRVDPGAYGFDSLAPLGSAARTEVAAVATAGLDTRDDPGLPTTGVRLGLSVRAAPAMLDLNSSYAVTDLRFEGYTPLPGPFSPVLRAGLRGTLGEGEMPFDRRPALGGSDLLPGLERDRFRGDAAAAASLLLRLNLLSFTALTDLNFGLHGLGSTGRVWLDGEQSDRWETTVGGGVWLLIPAISKGLSITLAGDGTGIRTYLDLGTILR